MDCATSWLELQHWPLPLRMPCLALLVCREGLYGSPSRGRVLDGLSESYSLCACKPQGRGAHWLGYLSKPAGVVAIFGTTSTTPQPKVPGNLGFEDSAWYGLPSHIRTGWTQDRALVAMEGVFPVFATTMTPFLN
eukprot:scaffold84130_cov19-Tisochrysis_lutea.AAC.1